MRQKAVVAMSGGVDSSVAAALMKEEGYDVTGIMLKLWKGPAANNESGCCSLDAAEDARRVAQVLDIPFYVFNFADYFSEAVTAKFLDAYAAGRTPNPCIECNRSVKFSALHHRAEAIGASVLATGHYARVKTDGGHARLLRGRDHKKDQSYVLYMLGQPELRAARFPVGDYSKPEIREIAESLGLRTAYKPESQEICFVPGGDVHAYLSDKLPRGSIKGPIVDSDGERVGTHRGFAHYTVGQRRGLGVTAPQPLFVREIRAGSNTLVVAPHDRVTVTELELENVSFTSEIPEPGLRASVMTRYRGPEAEATMWGQGGVWSLEFDEPQAPAAPGQAAVFYRGDEVIGGGTITKAR
jgi:tRNA-specific 2-thiouridylase